MSTTSLAAVAFRSEYIEALRASDAFEGVQVEANWMGPDAEAEAMELVDTRDDPIGGVRVTLTPAHTSTPQHFDDETVVPFSIRSPFAGETPAEGGDAENRVLELAWAAVDVLRTNPSLNRAVAWEQGITIEAATRPYRGGWAAVAHGSITIYKLIQ